MSAAFMPEWEQLTHPLPSGEGITARAIPKDRSGRIYCGRDARGRRHLLIRLESDEMGFEDTQSRGLHCTTRELCVSGGPIGRFIDLDCRDPTTHLVLDLLAIDLVECMNGPEPVSSEVVMRVLRRWRRFWARPPGDVLSRDEQLGLFAELWFLAFWQMPRVGVTDALERWVGPMGARHDFSWGSKAIEVKSTLSSRGRVFTISSLDQLAPPENGLLGLFGMRLREDASASNSLPALIASIREILESDGVALDRFETSLGAYGYSTAHDEEYRQMRILVREERLFLVHSDFPRLTSADIPLPRFPGIEAVRYEINLNSFEHLALNDPEDITQFLGLG